jgi:hypothetical protein
VAGSRAITVPLGILVQHAQVGGRRLPKFNKWEKPKVVRPQEAPWNATQDLLQTRPWMAKYYCYYGPSKRKYQCRWCEDISDGLDVHTNCFSHINKVGDRLFDLQRCCICDMRINVNEAKDKYDRCPVCSPRCLEVWKMIIGDSFTRERASYMKGLTDGTTKLNS